ncbi:maternal protein tudor [Topomyia yanbarensis]|uniref:maternal protein tudor n=1 Tax=Topomyia yanbarensis TaxID=2498891 RepID=UPI00273B6F3A|nr:maternal protein tudor [Topomyia yanbarensis]XP_058824598.1 maternal protein tudor [Topomyia yanbarensis]XP_058824599.1 maternal protein tudor [Topomyia yanbarensis]XP_058824600.1 maternal protein tudor [Topomyia yanbarensis]XP_058824601.1 maternal protein tudor [Topomyia yanbarensis]XP_058824602.1 maternal protein tudor [Topomyia yanbarensis]
MSTSGRFQSVKNLQPARSLRTPAQNHNGPGNFGLAPEQIKVFQPVARQSNGNGISESVSNNGFRSPSSSSSNASIGNNGYAGGKNGQRRHDVLRSQNTSFGSNTSLISSGSGKDIHTIVTFSSTTLTTGSMHEVYVSFVENGPKLFAVQLKASENALNQMMSALERVELRNLSRKPTLGMACIARFSEDQVLYRALIMGINVDSCLVSYVDYGNSETVDLKNLYEIPKEFLKHKIFSMRFTLSNVKTLDDANADIAGLFSSLVLDKLLTMKVMPLEGPAFVQYCELYENNENVFEKLYDMCKAKPLKFPKAISLDHGSSCIIIIRFIQSCKQFYVQPVENADSFDKLMDQLADYWRKSSTMNALNSGDPCAVCLDGNEYYRAEVVSVIGSKAKVRLVDYGATLTVEKNQIRRLSPTCVEQPPQVAECCLDGFQDISDDNLSTTQLEMLAENENGDRKQYKLTVSDIVDGVAIVNLLDESVSPMLNVSKRLLKLKNPAKFIKEQQQMQQQQLQAQQSKPVAISTKQTFQSAQSAQVLPVPPQPPTINSRNPFHSSTVMSETMNLSQTTCPRMAESEIIDLTSDDWEPAKNRPLDSFGAGYEQTGGSTYGNSNYGGSSVGTARPGSTRSGRDSHNSSRDANSSIGSTKKERFQRPDIPRFNKERNPTPHYIEHDNRCEENNSYEHHDNRGSSRDKLGAHKGRQSDTGSESGFNTQSAERPNSSRDSFKSSTVSLDLVEDYVPYDFSLPEHVIPMNTKVAIKLTWWVSPEEFYVFLKDEEIKYDEMMKQIQKFYKTKTPVSDVPPVGSNVIVRYQKHNTFYRAEVIKYNEALGKFKVELYDCGIKTIVTNADLWKLERRFAKMPKMAIPCTLANIKMICEAKELLNKIDTYVSNDRSIECLFHDRVEEKYVCDVETDGADLKMGLMKDNLIAQILTDIDLNRLKGQTLKLKLVEIKGLDQFRVKIFGSDAVLNCRQVEYGAYEQFVVDEIQSKWLDQYCFAQVEDVSNDDRLILTLLISPLSSQTPPTIVDMPILQNKFNVLVTYVHEPNCVYVTNTKWNLEIGKLLDDLYDYYEKTGDVIQNLQVNELCASKSADGNWYRSKIISLQDVDNIEVLLVDYGNREQVKHQDLKVLEPQFREYSAFAHRVYLPMACLNEGDESRLKTEISLLTGDFELQLTVLDYRNDIWIVDITSNDYSIVQVLKDKQLARDLDHEEILNQKTIVNNDCTEVVSDKPEEEVEDEPKYQKLKAFVSHVDNPNQLFLQMSSDLVDLDQLQENLQIIAQALPQLKDFSVNRYCIAPYSADDLWYRARIIDSHDDLIIQFIDFGNSDVITSNRKSDLKDVNDSLMKFKIYAKQCSLLVTPASGKKSWNEEATMILRELEEVELQILAECQGVNYINLKCGDRDLGEELISKQLAVKMEYVPSDQRCFTSHIESIREFYLQLERDVNPLDVMSDYMARFEEFALVDDPKVGLVYVAEFPDDGLWYRARILEVLKDNGFEVFFLDYGNTSRVKNVRELEPIIAKLPSLCTKCTLKIPDGVKAWSEEAEDKFKEIAAMGETVFTVVLRSPGLVATVELFLDGVNINDQLMDLCEKGASSVMNSSFYLSDDKTQDDNYPLEGYVFVSHVNSPADFYIQFKNTFDALKNMEELLTSKAAQCERLTHDEIYEGMYCLAYLVSYNKYYRAQIISATNRQYKVQLIDYGFTSFATDLRKMPAGIEQISVLAKKCCLETYSPNEENVLEVVQKRFVSLTDSGRAPFSFEIVRNDSEPSIVRLFTEDGKNVEDLLECVDSANNNDSNFQSKATPAEAAPPPTPADLVKTARPRTKPAFFRAKSDLEL